MTDSVDSEKLVQEEGDSDKLAGYVNTMFYNAHEFFTKQKRHARLFRETARIFHDGREFLAKRDPGGHPTFFFVAAESAYLAAAYLSAAMVTLETWKPLRGCLESAAYGYYIFLNPSRFRPWLDSGKDEKTERATGYEFSFSKICRETLSPPEPKLATTAMELYRESIQRGGHFNQLGFRSNLTKINVLTGQGKFTVIGGQIPSILYSWRKTLEVAHTSLRIFDLIFTDKWNASGVGTRIYKLQESIRKLPKGSM